MSRSKFIFLFIILLSSILRFTWLDRFPPSLYTDEANQGYNAYSILLTGRDEHGVFLPVSFRSFGDWKPPLPTYLMIPFIYIFGLNETAVRLPSAILGVGTVILTYFLVKELLKNNLQVNKIALLTSFFLTISAWHILQSRAAMLVMIGLFFLELSVFLFLIGIRNYKYLILSILSFTLSTYSYYGLRVVTPLMILILIMIYRKRLISLLKPLLLSFSFGLVLILPLFINFLKEPNVFFGRAKTVSVFHDRGIRLSQNELITQDGFEANYYLVRFVHNKIYMYSKNIVQRYLSHWDFKYLFFDGDKANPFRLPNMGIFYFIDALFIVYGVLKLMREGHKEKYIVFFWISIAFLPAAFTFITPSSNRTFNTIVPYMLLVALGLVNFSSYNRRKFTVILLIPIIYIWSFQLFLYRYFIVIPLVHPQWWTYELSALGKYISKNEKKIDNIVIFNEYNMSYVYILFHTKYNPAKYQKEAIRTYVADEQGFEHVESFGKYIFYNDLKWADMTSNLLPKTIYVVPSSQALEDKDYVYAIRFPNGTIAYKVFTYLKLE